jgi:RimJ/RimL family protein N-acetyltransferase
MILLETLRLRLRRFAPDDVDRLAELDSDPEVMRYITYGVPTPRAVYEDVIQGRSEARRAAVKYSITRAAWLVRRA